MLAPVLLFMMLVVLLCIPPMRGFLQGRTATCTSRTANVRVGIKHVSLHFPLGLLMQSMRIMRTPSALLALTDLGIRIRTVPLFGKGVRISSVAVRHMTIGSTGLVRNVRVHNMLKHFFLRDRKMSLNGRLTIVGHTRLSSARVKLVLASAAAARGPSATSTPIG